MAKITIYVNDGLKARMDVIEEPLNWSAIASKAFDIELGKVAERKKEMEMIDVIQRLRADKLGSRATAHNEGFTDGQHWAMEAAGYDQLVRLAAWAEGENWMDTFYNPYEPEWPAMAFYLAVEGKEPPDLEQDNGDGFWERAASAGEASVLTSGYVHGFAEGALNVFSAVRDRL